MNKFTIALLILLSILFIWSGINPFDRFTWYLEVAPAVIGFIILALIYPKFKFTNFTLLFIAIEMAILIIGGKYTYANMPLFDYLAEIFEWQRNHYDRVGHFAQGFVPALVMREIFIRNKVINGAKWMFFIILFAALAISATYEIIEFIAANMLGEAAHEFLGTQGDVWDTQWDMTIALIGAFTALTIFSKSQDRAISRLEDK